MIIMISIVLLSIGFSLYKRYFPVGHPFLGELTSKEILLDVRDYQTTFKNPVDGSIQMPYGYLRRYYQEIPDKDIVVISKDTLEKNLTIRFLKKKGFQVKGFIIIADESKYDIRPNGLNECICNDQS